MLEGRKGEKEREGKEGREEHELIGKKLMEGREREREERTEGRGRSVKMSKKKNQVCGYIYKTNKEGRKVAELC